MILLLAAVLTPAAGEPAPDLSRAGEEAAALVEQTRDREPYGLDLGEDADRGSFGLDGPEPLPNFGRVDGDLLRAGQPNREGFRLLAEKGVKTVLTLRWGVSEDELTEGARRGIFVLNVRMDGIFLPSFDQVDRALSDLREARKPLLVHCRYGKDRTGVVVAAYRVAEQGWEISRAVEESERFGCCHRLFDGLDDYLRKYLAHRAQRGHGSADAPPDPAARNFVQ